MLWTDAQQSTLAALADALIPRTDTPSATDVRVPAWITVIMTDYYTPTERAVVTDGLDAIEALALQMTGRAFTQLSGEDLVKVMTALDGAADRTTPAVRGYQRIKGLVVHGYFTSKPVQQQVLKTQIMPGRFVGDAPLRVTARRAPHDAHDAAPEHTHHEDRPHV